MEAYVAGGLGIGVSLANPGKVLTANVRAVPLDGFPPVVIGAMWRGRKTPLIELLLNEMQRRARQFA